MGRVLVGYLRNGGGALFISALQQDIFHAHLKPATFGSAATTIQGVYAKLEPTCKGRDALTS